VDLVREPADESLVRNAMVGEVLDGCVLIERPFRCVVVERYHDRLDRLDLFHLEACGNAGHVVVLVCGKAGLVVVFVRPAPFERWERLGKLVERALVGRHGSLVCGIANAHAVFRWIWRKEKKVVSQRDGVPLKGSSGEPPGVGPSHLLDSEALFSLSSNTDVSSSILS
jgi:hypothetical protein